MNRLRRHGGDHGAARGSDQGSMAVEIVIIMPVLFLFTLFVVACGRYVGVRGELESTTRDAVRAASLERDAGSMGAAVQDVLTGSLDPDLTCGAPAVSRQADGAGATSSGVSTVSVQLSCTVSYADLGLLGLPGSARLTTTSTSPIDPYRRSS